MSMRNELLDEVKLAAGDQLLTKGEVAKTLRSSRQRIVDLCRSGHRSFVTVGLTGGFVAATPKRPETGRCG